jgi:hypothetical protein
MVGAREVLIEYESEDDEANYEYSHRFRTQFGKNSVR